MDKFITIYILTFSDLTHIEISKCMKKLRPESAQDGPKTRNHELHHYKPGTYK